MKSCSAALPTAKAVVKGSRILAGSPNVTPRAYRPQRGRGHVTGTLAKFKPRLKIVQISACTRGVQTAAVTIISYIPLSDLNFAVCTGQYWSYMPSPPLGSISPW